MHDLIIRGGIVVDGTGAPARTADVAVSDGAITAVGRVDGLARRDIDADGLLVTPGFVDVHTHYDGQATWDELLTPSCWHGVTTAVLGNCGVGFAPVRPDRHAWLIALMEGVEDIPGTALSEGIQWQWESFPEYLDALATKPRVMDVATHLPHGALRAYVMGERGADNADATAEDLAAMKRLAVEALAAGAVGISTSRTAGHMALDGRPVPGTFAATEELWALGEALTEHGRGLLQLVPSGSSGELAGDPPKAMDAELDWMISFASQTRRPVVFGVLQSGLDPDGWRDWFARVAAARAEATPIYPQVASRCFGVLMGHQSRLNPFRLRPSYMEIAHLPLGERVRLLRDPDRKQRILSESSTREATRALDSLGAAALDNVFPLGEHLDYEPPADASLGARARAANRDVREFTYDAMLDFDGREMLLFPLLNYGRGSYDGLFEMMSDPSSVQGLGDGGAHCNVITDASMTTFMLTHWARDRSRGGQLTVEQAVRRLTKDPADLYGFTGRGALMPGMKADINLIDHESLALERPMLINDLPGGAGRLVQKAQRYVATFNAGEVVMSEGEPTGALPGQLVRQ